jgi:hypothetical protein
MENKEYFRCGFLRAELSLNKLRKVCEALDVKYERDDDANELCVKLAIKRPDLMRGRIWNIFRALYRKFDFTTENGFLALKRFGLIIIGRTALIPMFGIAVANLGIPFIIGILSDPYGWAEFITYLGGNTKNAVGYGKFALQRNDARNIIGDTRNIPHGLYTKFKSKWIEKKDRPSSNTGSRTSRKRSSVQRKSRKQQSKKHPAQHQ